MIIEVKIHQRDSFVRKNMISQFVNLISSDSYVKIFYKIKNLSANRDFLFESSSEVLVSIYVHVIDVKTIEIIVRNESERSMKISRNFKLEVTQEIQYEDRFYVSQKHHLTLQISKKNQMTKVLKAESVLIEDSEKSRLRASSKNSRVRVFAKQVDDKFEQKISFDVTVYENDVERQKFDRMINEFSDI